MLHSLLKELLHTASIVPQFSLLVSEVGPWRLQAHTGLRITAEVEVEGEGGGR